MDSQHAIRPKNLFISEATDTIYLVMEYVPYRSLARLMQQGTLTPRQIHKVSHSVSNVVCSDFVGGCLRPT